MNKRVELIHRVSEEIAGHVRPIAERVGTDVIILALANILLRMLSASHSKLEILKWWDWQRDEIVRDLPDGPPAGQA